MAHTNARCREIVERHRTATLKVALSLTFHRGRLAQLVRAPALQAGGRRFESCTAHQFQTHPLLPAVTESLGIAHRAGIHRLVCRRKSSLGSILQS